jgi:hypothetical protein
LFRMQHCSMATLIGLSMRVKLMRSLPSRFKVCVDRARACSMRHSSSWLLGAD